MRAPPVPFVVSYSRRFHPNGMNVGAGVIQDATAHFLMAGMPVERPLCWPRITALGKMLSSNIYLHDVDVLVPCTGQGDVLLFVRAGCR